MGCLYQGNNAWGNHDNSLFFFFNENSFVWQCNDEIDNDLCISTDHSDFSEANVWQNNLQNGEWFVHEWVTGSNTMNTANISCSANTRTPTLTPTKNPFTLNPTGETDIPTSAPTNSPTFSNEYPDYIDNIYVYPDLSLPEKLGLAFGEYYRETNEKYFIGGKNTQSEFSNKIWIHNLNQQTFQSIDIDYKKLF